MVKVLHQETDLVGQGYAADHAILATGEAPVVVSFHDKSAHGLRFRNIHQLQEARRERKHLNFEADEQAIERIAFCSGNYQRWKNQAERGAQEQRKGR